MSVRVTSKDQVALYDSTNGEAFGPIFETEGQAEDFLDWLVDEHADGKTFQYKDGRLFIQGDPRKHRPDELKHLQRKFLESQ